MRGIASRQKSQGRRRARSGSTRRSGTAQGRKLRKRRGKLDTRDSGRRSVTVLPLSIGSIAPLADEEINVPGIVLPALEPRLQRRYATMVQSHLRSAHKLAAGVASLPSTNSAFAATQGAWRFLNNETVSLFVLIEPLRE